MSNSPLINKEIISPNSSPRSQLITKITLHHAAGLISAEELGRVFLNPAREASCSYAIGGNGAIIQVVKEENAPWTSSSFWNDQQAVTFEIANSSAAPNWEISAAALEAVINLSVDICIRNPGIVQVNGKRGLTFTGDKNGSLTYHYMFAATECPGPFIRSRTDYIVSEVNRRLAIKLNEKENEEMTPDYLIRQYQFIDNTIPLGLKKELQEAVDLKLVSYDTKKGFSPLLSEDNIRQLVWSKRAALAQK